MHARDDGRARAHRRRQDGSRLLAQAQHTRRLKVPASKRRSRWRPRWQRTTASWSSRPRCAAARRAPSTLENVEGRFEVESAVACVEATNKSNCTLLDARNLASATEAAAQFHQLNIAADDLCASASQSPPSNNVDDDHQMLMLMLMI